MCLNDVHIYSPHIYKCITNSLGFLGDFSCHKTVKEQQQRARGVVTTRDFDESETLGIKKCL